MVNIISEIFRLGKYLESAKVHQFTAHAINFSLLCSAIIAQRSDLLLQCALMLGQLGVLL